MIGEMDMGHDGRIQMSRLDAAWGQSVRRDRFPAENVRVDDPGLKMFGRNRSRADMAGLDRFIRKGIGRDAPACEMAAAHGSCADMFRPDALCRDRFPTDGVRGELACGNARIP